MIKPIKLPKNESYYKQARELHRLLVLKLKNYPKPTKRTRKIEKGKLELYGQIHTLHNIVMEQIEVEDYNEYAVNYCKFRLFEECEGDFKNTFKHYQIHGNCCSSCSAFAYNSSYNHL